MWLGALVAGLEYLFTIICLSKRLGALPVQGEPSQAQKLERLFSQSETLRAACPESPGKTAGSHPGVMEA